MYDVLIKTLWIYGLAIVVSMVVAVVIKLVVVILGRLEGEAKPKPAEAPRTTAPPRFDPTADHVAAISAAVYAALGSVRIVHIEETRHHEGWLAEGRHAHHASHGFGRRSKH